MKAVKIMYGQTVVDLAIQELGDAARVYDIAALNDISVTDDLQPGVMLWVPDPESDKGVIVQVFATAGNKPASDEGMQYTNLEGIDYWAIERKFVIS